MPPRLSGSTLNALASSLSSLRITATKTYTESTSQCMKCFYEQGIKQNERMFHSSPVLYGKPKRKSGGKQKKDMSPWAIERRENLRKKNIQRQQELTRQRLEAAADPIVGKPTEFNQSIHSHPAPPLSVEAMVKDIAPEQQNKPDQDVVRLVSQKEQFGSMVFNISPKELQYTLTNSKNLTKPFSSESSDLRKIEDFEDRHSRATLAMSRILSLGNSSSKDVKHAHNQLCIDMFGRHNTDKTLTPRMKRLPNGTLIPKVAEPRGGPDCGSSEVQIAILTTKIQALERHVKQSPKDKHNNRNLRMLVHKRQGLLKYLKKKERGGARYQNIMDHIGLDDRAVTQELFI